MIRYRVVVGAIGIVFDGVLWLGSSSKFRIFLDQIENRGISIGGSWVLLFKDAKS